MTDRTETLVTVPVGDVELEGRTRRGFDVDRLTARRLGATTESVTTVADGVGTLRENTYYAPR